MWPVVPLLLASIISPITDALNVTRSTCPRCALDRDILKQMTKESIKEDMLRKLGFTVAPNITGKHLINHIQISKLIKKVAMLAADEDRYPQMQSDQGSNRYSINLDQDDHFQPSSVVIPAWPAPVPIPRCQPLYFKLSDTVFDSTTDLSNAILNVHLPAAPKPGQIHALISIYSVLVDKKTGAAKLSYAKDVKVELREDRGGWVPLHILRLTKRWMNHPEENLGVVITVETLSPGKEKLEIGAQGSDHEAYMQLDITDMSLRSRTKRTADRVCSEENDPETTDCCLWPLTIDFNEFGWDWVLFPEAYEANFCSGSCNLGTTAEHPHGTLAQMAQTGTHSTAGPCCAPRKMAPITMIYMDQDKNVILGKLANMKVRKCGCF